MHDTNRNNNRTITALYEARPGERCTQSGVFGVYYLGTCTGDLRVYSVGEVFPDAQVGTTFCLHAAF